MKFWFERGAWVSKKTQQQNKDLNPNDVRSIAIIRHAALGDLILVRAFIVEAKQFFPNASITLSVASNYQVGVPNDLVDRVHVAIGSDQREVAKLEQIRVAKSLGYHDLIFDLSVTSRSILLCLLNKAKIKVSYPYKSWQRILYDICIFRSDMQFEAEILLDMLRIFGATPATPMNFSLPQESLAADVKRSRPYVVYFTSASTDSKCWPQSSFAELIRLAATEYPEHEHVVLEGLADWESVNPLMKKIGEATHKNITVQKSISINQSLVFLKQAEVVVSNDTSIRNMAICCDTVTVGIFYSTVPYRYWPRNGRHFAAFNTDGSIPSVDKVLVDLKLALNKKHESS